MKMQTVILSFLMLLFVSVNAQTPVKTLKQVMTLEMPGENGTNGATVVWHPIQKKYYSAFAGNTTYPMAVFNVTGKLISPADLETGFDIRGLWYNSVSKTLDANGYADFGWAKFTLDLKGIPSDPEVYAEGLNQPDEQSVGVFDGLKKQVVFLGFGTLHFYSPTGEDLAQVLELKIEQDGNELNGDDEDGFSKYNTTTVCYTGIANAEFALLNVDELKIELYNRKGQLTRTYALPDDAPVQNMFNFAFANSTWWLFNTETRTWQGYK